MLLVRFDKRTRLIPVCVLLFESVCAYVRACWRIHCQAHRITSLSHTNMHHLNDTYLYIYLLVRLYIQNFGFLHTCKNKHVCIEKTTTIIVQHSYWYFYLVATLLFISCRSPSARRRKVNPGYTCVALPFHWLSVCYRTVFRIMLSIGARFLMWSWCTSSLQSLQFLIW